MKIATVSHSHIARRQQLFFEEVAKQGHQVLMISPGEWYGLRAKAYNRLSWGSSNEILSFRTCKHIGDNVYTYRLLGAKDLIEDFNPDWLYVQAEPGSVLAGEALSWKVDKRALFTWENLSIKGEGAFQLPKYDLVVCGNPDAVELVTSHNDKTALMLQVGVDTNHFQARPNVIRNIEVAYVGRPAPEKGLPYLTQAWPTVRVLEWKDFLDLPWWYSQIEVVVAFSQDTPLWREQAPNYVVLEALSCGCEAVISDTAAMKYWLEGCPGVVVVEGHRQGDNKFHIERIMRLKEGIFKALYWLGNKRGVNERGRTWVINNFSNVAMAKRLLGVLENA